MTTTARRLVGDLIAGAHKADQITPEEVGELLRQAVDFIQLHRNRTQSLSLQAHISMDRSLLVLLEAASMPDQFTTEERSRRLLASVDIVRSMTRTDEAVPAA